jgi:hypothetical protein
MTEYARAHDKSIPSVVDSNTLRYSESFEPWYQLRCSPLLDLRLLHPATRHFRCCMAPHPSHLWFWCKYFRFRALSLMVTTRARWHRPRLSSIWPSNHTHCDAHQGPQGTSEEESPKGSKSSIIFMISCKTIVHNKKGVSLPYGFHHINAHLCLIHGQHAMLGEG